jgi:hypothetical protein
MQFGHQIFWDITQFLLAHGGIDKWHAERL